MFVHLEARKKLIQILTGDFRFILMYTDFK